MMSEKIQICNPAYEIENDVPEFLYLNAIYEVCDTCHGKGTTVNPSIDGNGISREQFDEDPDFAESYFRGDYDVPCRKCKGIRVVLVPDEADNPPELLEIYRKEQEEDYRYAQERYQEMRAEGQEVYMSDFGY